MNKATIVNRSFSIDCPPKDRVWSALAPRIEEAVRRNGTLIRLILVKARGAELVFEGSFLQTDRELAWPSLLDYRPAVSRPGNNPFVALSIIPTGVRAEIGGFAGDATPSTNLLARACDYLITNPNSVTASDIYNAGENIFYLEGNLITHFLLGHLDLQLQGPKSIGVLIEQPREERFLNNVLNALNAQRATGGLAIDPVVVTEKSLSAECRFSEFGHASASFNRMDELVRGLDIIYERGAGAVALSSTLVLDDRIRQQYYNQEIIPNPWGGAEAILTHTVTNLFPLTAAHAPLLAELSHSMFGTLGDPRDSAELISTAYICSVIKGLSRSPRPIVPGSVLSNTTRQVAAGDISAVVMPANAVGNVVFFSALEQNIPLILVRGNHTLAGIDPETLGINGNLGTIYYVDSYLEAAGVLLALKSGLSLESLRRPLAPLSPIYLGKKLEDEQEFRLQLDQLVRA
ncbi:MAG: hypothetical protein A3F83_02435 [Candidatus Glassbacteria bacterium RIFCSPLOWO2_12_FULL_58_11]|uniref:High light inducible protein n=1 Tax=Candidatus Glassbacteria bacterium RIFCSPLOWO2_12_FULL_58_11 TaxID=1817867 RepID=A0A1F5YPK9_9BACT|nr:MAG: hypothetical protein A3F83_02435 [Candidatus Glassbacteria bacterium RIFCSPLOWO2_12_FULL_58_11]